MVGDGGTGFFWLIWRWFEGRCGYSVHCLEILKCIFKTVLLFILKYSYPDADWSSQGTFSSF